MAVILVADDDRDTRELVRLVLAHAGHAVVEAKTGAEALESAAALSPDLILLDLSMPGMSGADFLRALRADPHTKTTRVALYTASPMSPAVRDFMEIYAVGNVVPKPCEPLELIAAVEEALKRPSN